MKSQRSVRYALLRSFLLVIASVCFSETSHAQWRAFNCQALPGAHPNDTFYTVPGWGTTSGPLKNIATGAFLPAYLTITNGGSIQGAYPLNAPPLAGTPAYIIFNGYVSWRDPSGTAADHFRLFADGVIGYRFTGLNPQKRYRFTATVVRGGVPGSGAPNYYSNRWTRVELVGAYSSVVAHTAGVITTDDFPADLTGTQVAFNSGVNTSGDVVAWEEIVPGQGGSFTMLCTKYGGHFIPGNTTATANAAYAYSLSQLKLEEVAVNLALSITLVSPTNGQTIGKCALEEATLALTGYPTGVSYYVDNTLFAHQTASPWPPIALPLLPPGPHTVFASAQDTNGTLLYTATNTFTVRSDLAASFTRGPFVQNVSTGGLQIIWRTSVPGSSFVTYGPTEGGGFSITNPAPVTNHVVTIGNLEPDTLYYYSVGSDLGCGALRSANETVRTLKDVGSIRFLVVGDTAGGYSSAVAEVMRDQAADLVVHLGDIVYSGFSDAAVGLEFFDAFQPQIKNVPFYLIPGNHDIDSPPDPTALNFRNAFYLPTNSATGTEIFYSFDHGDVHFTCLFNPWFVDYVFREIDSQYTWLTNDLAKTTKPWKFLFLHLPIATSSYHALDDYNGGGLGNGILDQTEMMNLMLPVAQRYGVQMVFGSHDHDFERFAPTNGLHHLVSGGGGRGIYEMYVQHEASAQFWPAYHSVVVAVTNDTLTIQAVGTNGAVFDAMTVQRALPPPQLYHAAWNSPAIETAPANNDDGNIMGQSFNFIGTPIYPRAGKFSNLGRVYVNNDATHLSIGFEQVMLYRNNNVFLFIESPRQSGRTTLAGVGNGRIDPEAQGADGLDCLENLAFSGFTPSVGCILGDEYADGQFRSFVRSNLALNIGQGVFRLDAELSYVPGVRLQQFNHSPETRPTLPFDNGETGEQNADLIELAIPFSALGDVHPGDTIKLGAVVGGGGFDPVAQTRQLDSSVLGCSLTGSSETGLVLEGVSVQLAIDPSAPLLTITPIGPDQYRLSWNAQLGRSYDIEHSPRLTNFISLGAAGLPVTAGSTNESFVVMPSGSSTRFYRLRVLP